MLSSNHKTLPVLSYNMSKVTAIISREMQTNLMGKINHCNLQRFVYIRELNTTVIMIGVLEDFEEKLSLVECLALTNEEMYYPKSIAFQER